MLKKFLLKNLTNKLKSNNKKNRLSNNKKDLKQPKEVIRRKNGSQNNKSYKNKKLKKHKNLISKSNSQVNKMNNSDSMIYFLCKPFIGQNLQTMSLIVNLSKLYLKI